MLSDLPFAYLNKQQKELWHSMHHFAKSTIRPHAKSIETNQAIPKEIWLKMGKQGALGITAPKKYGGLNQGYVAQCITMSAISQACASVGLSYSAHSNLCINQLVRFANPTQCEKYLPKLISGEWIGALAISEENAGSDAMRMQLIATPNDNGYTLNGEKKWITNAPDADVIIVYAKMLNPTGSKTRLSSFIIDKAIKNWHTGDNINKIGMRGSKTSRVYFDNCQVSQTNLLGEINRGSNILMSGLDFERAVLAAGPLGIIKHCLEIATEYVTKRKQFGEAIGNFQLIQAKLANMYTTHQAVQALVYNTAYACDQNLTKSCDAASSILFASESATQVALDTIQILGGNGYTTNFAAGTLLNDAKLYEIGAGTAEIRRLLIGKQLQKIYLSGDLHNAF